MFLLLYCLTFDFPSPLNLQTPYLRPQAGFGLASSPSLLGSSIPVSQPLLFSAVGTSNSAGVACSAHLARCWILPLQSYQSNLLLTAQRVPGTHILAPDVISSSSSYSFACAETKKASEAKVQKKKSSASVPKSKDTSKTALSDIDIYNMSDEEILKLDLNKLNIRWYYANIWKSTSL